ncbi:hypothetical protein [Algoriphagus boritolerans]|uniref:hypothetical protein n=1 Tax=Algoriphagus boritolerans TaxID=308111 RepID=UPI002FCDFA73
MMKEYQTFKMIEEDYSDKRNERIKHTFRDKLIEFGFEEASENPDFFNSGSHCFPGFHQGWTGILLFVYSWWYFFMVLTVQAMGRLVVVIKRRLIEECSERLFFLIQDSKTNEIAWMGISSGVVYGGDREFDLDKVDLVLHQLLTSLY